MSPEAQEAIIRCCITSSCLLYSIWSARLSLQLLHHCGQGAITAHSRTQGYALAAGRLRNSNLVLKAESGFLFIYAMGRTSRVCHLTCFSVTDNCGFTLNFIQTFNVHGSVHRNNILIYIQQDAMLHSLFDLETALHVSGGTITHHRERKQLYLQHLVFVRPLLLPGVTNTRCCRSSCLRSS